MDAFNKKIASFYKLLANQNHFLNKEVQRLPLLSLQIMPLDSLWPGFNCGEVVMQLFADDKKLASVGWFVRKFKHVWFLDIMSLLNTMYLNKILKF